MSNAMELFKAERQRQINVEGWTPGHDDEHADGEMMRAAMIYLHHGTDKQADTANGVPIGWPWSIEWWKPKDRRSNLIRAGALMLAERERIVRAHDKRRRLECAPRGLARNHRPKIWPAAPVGHIDHKLALAEKYLNELQL